MTRSIAHGNAAPAVLRRGGVVCAKKGDDTMNLEPTIMARAGLALNEAIRAHLFDRNVGFIDFGLPRRQGQIAEDELAVRIHVRKKLSDAALETAVEAGHTRPIPRVISDFRTDVLEGTYRPHFGNWRRDWWRWPVNPRATRTELLRGGLSISDEYHYTYGTLGGKVIDRDTGAEMLLSNWHVLVAEWGARPGQRIFQPGRLDGGTDADTVATLTRDAMSFSLDAAVATLNGSRALINDQLYLGPVSGVSRAELGAEVVKSGRATDKTYGRVTGVMGTARMVYGRRLRLERIIRNVMTIEPNSFYAEVSAGGDSGSWWLDAETRQAVGLHFAGSDFPERALAHDMPTVLEALNVAIAAGQ
jgi:endonuclease G